MRIVSASRRTDIPAFYTPWLLKRLQAGFCHWINPYGGQVKRVSLRPEDCLAIVFWTRNPAPLLPHLPALRSAGYHCYFHYTINGYPRAIESHNPPLGAAVDTFRRLAATMAPDLVHWRYDPIVLSDATPADYHLARFAALARHLEGHTRRCYFSFVDFYGKTERNLRRVERDHDVRFSRPDLGEQRQLTRRLREIAAAHGIALYSCCNDGLVGEGVERSRCIDLDTIALLRPDLPLAVRAAPTRQDCGCVECDDIGAYDTCAFGCAYCYATNSRAAALQRRADHDPEDTVLWRPLPLRGVDLATREVRPKARLSSGGRGAQLRLFGAETPG
jgi:hypothetical protein